MNWLSNHYLESMRVKDWTIIIINVRSLSEKKDLFLSFQHKIIEVMEAAREFKINVCLFVSMVFLSLGNMTYGCT